MIVTGIIAEYNPFHNGHAYQIKQARQITQADYVVVVMSGDYVQRGTPAIMEKHLRARMALEHGADLVLELPVRFSTASARDFARGAVTILHDLGVVNYLCFGSEHGEITPFLRIAELLEREPAIFQETIKNELKKGASYPAAHQKALLVSSRQLGLFDDREDFPFDDFLEGPNNTLGIEYVRALRALNSPIIPCTVARTSNNYHSIETDSSFASATAIRHLLFHKTPDALTGLIPENLIPTLMEAQRGGRLITEDDYSLLLKYVLMQNTPQRLADYLDFPITLANRVANTIQDFCSFSQFAEMLKTREITRVRINRALLHAVLQLEQTASPPSFIRMLGFRKEAAELLKAIKNSSSRMVIGKLADAPLETYREDLFASNLYHSVLAMKVGKAAPDERSIPLVII